MSINSAWLMIITAGLMEPIWVFLLSKSEGGTKPLPLFLAGLVIAGSFTLFTLSLKGLSINMAYVIWVGIGALSVATLGFITQDQLTVSKFLFISLILTGVIGLRYVQ